MLENTINLMFKHQSIHMKSLISTLIFAVAVFFSSNATAKKTWVIDATHSNIGFTVTHLAISQVDGKFTNFEGSLVQEGEALEGATVSFSADVASIDTDNEKRDGHLQSPDFFDAANHPKVSFTSTAFEKTGENTYKLTGDLTMHGVTKPVTLDVTYGGSLKDPYGNTKAGFKIRGDINRTDFGLTWNAALEAGGVVVSEEVELVLNVQMALQK